MVTRELVVRSGALAETALLFRRHFPECTPFVVADSNTYRAAGSEVVRILRAEYADMASPVILDGDPLVSPKVSISREISQKLLDTNVVGVAVGSGTINDIVKLASHMAGISYMVVATAASMDGYASFGASMLVDGYKKTIPCPAPRAVLADLDVITHAPTGMTESGYADLVGKVTAGADWIVADELGVEPIRADIWEMVQPPLREWIRNPDAIKNRDVTAVKDLFDGLAVSALAMQAYQNTRPASGSEHLLSHVWEMEHLYLDGVPVSHGFKVGLGTLATCALFEVLFEDDLSYKSVSKALNSRLTPVERERDIRSAFGDTPYAESVIATGVEKHDVDESYAARVRRGAERWDTLRDRIVTQVPPFAEIRELLSRAGCPVSPAEIGISRERLAETMKKAQMIRPRYTTLDFVYDMGLLDSCVERIFSTDRYF
jgi:glycerol-1-phosphate dehydrogenase [NAD(P)+]